MAVLVVRWALRRKARMSFEEIFSAKRPNLPGLGTENESI